MTKSNTILVLTKSSLKSFVRNRQAFFFTLVFPIILISLLGLIGFDRVRKYDVGLVAEHSNPETQMLLEQIRKFPTLNITEGNLENELEALKEGDRAVVMHVPSDLINPSFQQRAIIAHINEGQQAQASTVVSVVTQMIDKALLNRVGVQSPITIQQNVVDSRNLKYIDFLLPGIIAMSVMQMTVFSVAFVFVQFKEKGILKRIMATPVKPSQFLTANIVTRLIVSVVQTIILIAVGVVILEAQLIGSYWLMLLIIVLSVLMFLGLGFIISGIAKTVETVPVFANLAVFPMMFLGGVFFPIDTMPTWLQKIANVLPLTYFSTSLREVMTEDAGFGVIVWDLVAMLAWALVFMTIATLTFRFRERE